MAVMAFERKLYLSDCPVHPQKMLEMAQEAVRGMGIYFVATCSMECGRYDACPWISKEPMLFVGRQGEPEEKE